MKSPRSTALRLVKNLFAVLLSAVVVVPFLVVVVNSLKTQAESDSMLLTLPASVQWSNYATVVREGHLARSFLNSVALSTFSVVVSAVLASMAAFVMSRNRSRANRFWYYVTVMGIALPLNYVSLMQIMKLTHLVNTLFGLGLLYAALQIPFSVFLGYGFISTVPQELDEAAVIDGTGSYGLFFSIILPLLTPVLVTIILLNFMGAWNDFVLPLYYLNRSTKWPMTIAVFNFFGQYQSSWNLVSADVVLTALPVIIAYVVGQRYIVAGMTAGSVKG